MHHRNRVFVLSETPEALSAIPASEETTGAPVSPQEPVPTRTRESASPGYRETLALALNNRPAAPAADPYIEEARQRQIAALRANRPSEAEHHDTVWADDAPAGLAPGSVEESLARARAYARQTRAGREPRRAFDAA
jgi:hypothetical protein